LFNAGALFIKQEIEREIINSFQKAGIGSLQNKRVLDVGCGSGGWLREMIKWGAQPKNLFGISLLCDRIEAARKLNPEINFICADASSLPYSDESFDILNAIYCF